MRRSLDKPLLCLLAAGLVIHVLVFWGNLASPYGRVLSNDAEYYWDWGGRVAGGEWVGDAPFFAAPLYPYLLGIGRMLGVGLLGVASLQLVLHVATAGILARVATQLWERRVGLVVAGLWLVLADPAGSHPRVLAGTLQVFLVAVLLERCLAFQAGPTPRAAVLLGVLAGVVSLAWPAMLPACGVLALWAFWIGAKPMTVGAFVLAAGATIAPATVHNWLAARTFVPISAHAGITFWHGNNPSAEGVFAAHGVSSDKVDHDQDALARTREALGPDADWGDVSGHYLGKGLDWWKAEPGRAVGLMGKKAWLFCSARTYGDMYLPSLERDAGLWMSLWLAPVPVAWIVIPALLAALVLLRRDPKRFAPTVLVLLLPFAICAVFWYTPRYRLPALPAATLLAGWAAVELVTRRGRAPLLAVGFVLALASGLINRAAGVDSKSDLREQFYVTGAGHALREGRTDQAIELWREVLGHPFPLGELRGSEHHATLVEVLEEMLVEDPLDRDLRYRLVWTLSTSPVDGVRDGERALEVAQGMYDQDAGRDPDAADALGAALAELGRLRQAAGMASRASQLYREQGRLPEADAAAARAALYGAGQPFRQEP